MLPPIAFFGQTWGGERLGDLFPRVVPVYCQHAALLRNFPLPPSPPPAAVGVRV